MEHRHHTRVVLDLGMLIYRRGMPVATGRIRDASRSGAFIETDYRELREHQHLEFEFRLVGAQPDTWHRVDAHVLRQTQNGIAIEVDEYDRGAAFAMGSLLGSKAIAGTGALPAGGVSKSA